MFPNISFYILFLLLFSYFSFPETEIVLKSKKAKAVFGIPGILYYRYGVRLSHCNKVFDVLENFIAVT